MKKARSLLYGKLYGESDTAIIFFNFNCLATGIWDLKPQSQGGDPKNIVIKYGFIVFKMTAQNTRTEQKNLQHSKSQSGGEICKKHSKIPQPNQTA